jgi:hypothetical protein
LASQLDVPSPVPVTTIQPHHTNPRLNHPTQIATLAHRQLTSPSYCTRTHSSSRHPPTQQSEPHLFTLSGTWNGSCGHPRFCQVASTSFPPSARFVVECLPEQGRSKDLYEARNPRELMNLQNGKVATKDYVSTILGEKTRFQRKEKKQNNYEILLLFENTNANLHLLFYNDCRG